ncbi:MAG TPA: long-chain fatty acid--CoA ligase [Candidatus Saccharimonadales bacterium]|nr:long-chain fatty acid--CoA ligase [Candidatus Saccharimonadales bacterium]
MAATIPTPHPALDARSDRAGTAERVVPVQERTLVELFRRQAASRGDNPAMFHRAGDHWASITWNAYAQQARELAAFLIDAGLEEGRHVAIWSFNRPEFIVTSTATMLARACTAPLYQTLSAAEAGYVLGHSDSPIAVVENEHLLAKVLEVRDRLPALQCVVLMEGDAPAEDCLEITSWIDALTRGRDALGRVAAELDRRSEAVQPADVATLVYTSGTTGPPKAVMATHSNLIAAINALGPIVDLSAGDRVLSYLPLAHILERLNSEVRLYCAGNALWFAASIAEMPAEVRDIRPTCFVGVPRVWEKMASTIEAAIEAMPPARRRVVRWAIAVGEQAVDRRQRGDRSTPVQRLRLRLADRLVLRKIREETGLDQAHTLITGAAPIAVHVLRFFHALGLEILEGYGMSENMTVTSVNRRGHARLGTVGQAVAGVKIRIAGDGEIQMRGDVVFAGYYKNPVATAETVVDGWLHSGDIGELDAQGYLRITDRKKDLIITAGGKNVSPSNIEDALRSELIANPVVIGDRRPFIVALLTLDASALAIFASRHGLPAQPDELLRHPTLLDAIQRRVEAVNRGLASVEQVRRWILLPGEFAVGVELTPTYKVRRRVVAERFAAEIDSLYAPRAEAVQSQGGRF